MLDTFSKSLSTLRKEIVKTVEDTRKEEINTDDDIGLRFDKTESDTLVTKEGYIELRYE